MNSVLHLPDEAMPTPLDAAPDLTRLAAELCVREYADNARAGVLAYVRACGTLEGCFWVDPDDRADLDAILEASWPAVGWTSHAWEESPWSEVCRQPAWTVADSEFAAVGAPELAPEDGEALIPPELDVEPFEPTDEDLEDYREWSESLPPYPMPELEPFQAA